MEVEAAQGQEDRIIQQVRAMEVRRQRLQIVLQLVQRLPSLAGAECLHTMMPTRKYFLLIFFSTPTPLAQTARRAKLLAHPNFSAQC